MNKTIRIPKELHREASILPATGEDKALRMSISSSEPYLRYDWYADEHYWEVLDHSPTGIKDARLKAGLPILFNHDRDQHLGTAKSYSNDGQKLTVGDIIWSESTFAQEKKKDAESGALGTTSVGYRVIDEGECIGAKDGHPIYKFKWEIHEGSLVTIPADISVGVGRQRAEVKDDSQLCEILIRGENNIDPSPKNGEKRATPKAMLKTPGQKFHEEADDNKGGVSVEVVAEREKSAATNALATERARLKKINEYVGSFNRAANLKKPIEELSREAIERGDDFDTFRATVMDNWKDATQLSGADAQGEIGMGKKDIRQFSFAKFLLESHTGNLTGIEKEASDAAIQKYQKDNRPGGFSGRCIPHDVMARGYAEIHDLNASGLRSHFDDVARAEQLLGRSQNATSFSAGGFLVGTQLLGGSYIDLLRNAALIGQGPFACIELSGLVGNIAIPKQTSTITTYWLAEGAAVSESNFAGAQLGFSPKRLVARNAFTKQLLAQSTPSIEMLVRNDMALATAVEEDRTAIQGTGLNGEPLGVINTSGIDASVTYSGNWTQADTLAFQLALENANVRTGGMVFLTSPTTKSYAMGTPQVSASTFPIYIWMPGNGEYPEINGVKGGKILDYPAYATKNATNRVLFGVWNNNFTKARWAGIDVVVNPYSGDASEIVYVTMTQWMDFGLRYPQAMSYSTDAPTNV